MRPSLLYLLDQLTAVPAQILSDLGDVLAQNAMAEVLFTAPPGTTGAERLDLLRVVGQESFA